MKWILFLYALLSAATHSAGFIQGTPTVDSINHYASSILNRDLDSAYMLANQSLGLAKQLDYVRGLADAHLLIGKIFYHEGVHEEALRHLLEAEHLHQSIGDKKRLAEDYNQQGLNYYSIRQVDLSENRHRKALALFAELKDNQGIAFSTGCLGRLYEKNGDYDEAIRLQQSALNLYQSINDPVGMATILENIGSIHEDLEDYAKSLDYFKQSANLNELTGDSLSLIINLNNIGDNYRKTGNYEEAIRWTTKAVGLAEKLNDKYQLSTAYKDLSKEYSLAENYQKAYEALETGRTLYEEMYGQDAARQAKLFRTLFEVERKNNEIERLETANRLDWVIKIALSVGLLLIAVLGIVIIGRQRTRIRKNLEDLKTNSEVYEAKELLLKADMENTRLHELKLQQELESKTTSLTTHTLHILGKNKILENIQVHLNEALTVDFQEQRKKVKGLVKMIDRSINQDKDWEDFRNIFEQVHQDFFNKLHAETKELTPADLRLAALIRLNFSSNDASTALGISKDSLRIARYRLRKKLALEKGQSLSNFISSL